MAVNFYRIMGGLQQKVTGVFYGQGTQCPYTSLMSPKSLCVKTLAKMLQGILVLLDFFTCTVIGPKPFTVKGCIKLDSCMQISTKFKTAILLKPFINDHLAVSQLGMRQVFWVSHFVSYLASKPIGQSVWALSQNGKVRQVNMCLILSHFRAVLFAAILQLHKVPADERNATQQAMPSNTTAGSQEKPIVDSPWPMVNPDAQLQHMG